MIRLARRTPCLWWRLAQTAAVIRLARRTPCLWWRLAQTAAALRKLVTQNPLQDDKKRVFAIRKISEGCVLKYLLLGRNLSNFRKHVSHSFGVRLIPALAEVIL